MTTETPAEASPTPVKRKANATKKSDPAKASGMPRAAADKPYKAIAEPSAGQEPVEMLLRRLARRHCRAAIRALSVVVKDSQTPAGARITAATTLVGWALGRESSEGAGKGQGAGKPSNTEQVVRLAWMESKRKRRGKAKGSKKETGKTGPGKGNGDKTGR